MHTIMHSTNSEHDTTDSATGALDVVNGRPGTGIAEINGRRVQWQTTFSEKLGFKCVRCGHSCRNNEVVLFKQDLARLGPDLNHAIENSANENDIYENDRDENDTNENGINGKEINGTVSKLRFLQSGDCSLLTYDKGLPACTVHSRKPALCREYPFKVVFSNDTAFIDVTLSCTSIIGLSTGVMNKITEDMNEIMSEVVKSTFERMPDAMDFDVLSNEAVKQAIEDAKSRIKNIATNGGRNEGTKGEKSRESALRRFDSIFAELWEKQFTDEQAIDIVQRTYIRSCAEGLAPYRHPMPGLKFATFTPTVDGIIVQWPEKKKLIQTINTDAFTDALHPLSMTDNGVKAVIAYLEYFIARASFIADVTMCLESAEADGVIIQPKVLIKECVKRIMMMLCYFSNLVAASQDAKEITSEHIHNAVFMIDNSVMTPAEEVVKSLLRTR